MGAAAPVQAGAAQAFVDSVGADVHLVESVNAYNSNNFAKLKSAIAGSGILHLRDGMPYNNTTVISEAQQLAAGGVRFDYIMGAGDTASQASGWFSSIGPNVADACEGLNEPDAPGGNWAPNAVSEQQAIYSVCHPKGLPVYGSAMINGADYATFGNVSAEADDANMHDYFSWRNPGTGGWGDNAYGSLQYNEANSSNEAPNKPFVATETGYSSYTGDTSSYLPEAVRARYLVRTSLEAFRSGVKRTYFYEFADEGGTGAYCNNGLIDSSFNQKASYGAVSGILSLLSDPNATFTPGSLNYTVSGADANMHTVLLQKHDGTFWLALWEETQEYTGDNKQTYQPASPEALTVAFAQTPGTITTHVLQDNGTYSSTAVTPSPSIALSVDGHPTLVQIKLQGAVRMVQEATANNGAGASYAIPLPSTPTTGDELFAALAARPSSTTTMTGFSVVDKYASNGYIGSTVDDHIVASGDSTAFAVNLVGGDWGSGVNFEVTGQDSSMPIASDTSANTTSANVTCPGSAAGATIRAGSFVTCFVYIVGGTVTSNQSQTPSAGSGWVFDSAAGSLYNEVYMFHRTALTTAGENVASHVINLSTDGGTENLSNSHEQTLVIQPPNS